MSRVWALALTGGGLATIAGLAGLYAWNRRGIAQKITSAASAPPGSAAASVSARLTTYYPLQKGLTAEQRRMEGGPEGAASWTAQVDGKPKWSRVVDPATGKRVRLVTLEQHLGDPARYPWAAIAGDPSIWPFGQRVKIPELPGATFRVVDTGGHFYGADKVFRVVGREPLDVCVDTSKSRELLRIPSFSEVAVIPGDNWQGGGAVAFGRAGRPSVVGGDYDGEMDQLLRRVLSV